MTVFISYSGGRVDRAQLVYSLREHGLTPWRDVESLDVGDETTDSIESQLASCSGVILWINDQVLGSEYVAKVELPAIARAERDRGVRIVPVFDGLSPSVAAERVSRFGFEIGENNGHVIDPGVSTEETAAAIAARYARSEVRAAHRAGRPPIVRLVSYDDTAAYREEAVLNLDWRHHFTDGAPGAESQLRKALDAATGSLKQTYGATEILVAAKAHLPLALALGHAFAEPTGCTLRMERDGAAYVAERRVDSVDALQERRYPKGPIDARAAAVEVALSRDTEAGVSAYVADGHRYRERIALSPPGGSGRLALDPPAACNAWAHQVGDRLSTLIARPDTDRVDLFLACPVELAVAIGWWSNATGPLEVLNWSGKSGPYDAMWHLP